MINFNEPIANAYVSPSRNIAIPSMPGRQVRFLQGHAVIKDGRDLVAMMRRPDVKIQLTPYAVSWVETWLAEAKTVRAEVSWPEPTPPPQSEPDPPLDPPQEPPDPGMVPQVSWDPAVRAELQSGSASA